MSRISLTCLVARPRLTARSASTIGIGSTSPRLAGDEVALLVAAGRRDRLHAGVVALGDDGRAVRRLLRRRRALAGRTDRPRRRRRRLGADADDEHRDAELARDRRPRARVSASASPPSVKITIALPRSTFCSSFVVLELRRPSDRGSRRAADRRRGRAGRSSRSRGPRRDPGAAGSATRGTPRRGSSPAADRSGPRSPRNRAATWWSSVSGKCAAAPANTTGPIRSPGSSSISAVASSRARASRDGSIRFFFICVGLADVVDEHRLRDVDREHDIEPAQLELALALELRPRRREQDQREREPRRGRP